VKSGLFRMTVYDKRFPQNCMRDLAGNYKGNTITIPCTFLCFLLSLIQGQA
jgi:hypothetical protein